MEGGHRAIKFNRFTGVGNAVYGEGIHFLIPLIERPIIYDIRNRPNSITSLTGSKGLILFNYFSNFQILQKFRFTSD